jgi:hypothetical protein
MLYFYKINNGCLTSSSIIKRIAPLLQNSILSDETCLTCLCKWITLIPTADPRNRIVPFTPGITRASANAQSPKSPARLTTSTRNPSRPSARSYSTITPTAASRRSSTSLRLCRARKSSLRPPSSPATSRNTSGPMPSSPMHPN